MTTTTYFMDYDGENLKIHSRVNRALQVLRGDVIQRRKQLLHDQGLPYPEEDHITPATWKNDDRNLGVAGNPGIHIVQFGTNMAWTGFRSLEEAYATIDKLNFNKLSRWYVRTH